MSPTSTLSVLFVDLGGSTGLYERLGDTAAKQLVDICLERLEANASEHQGVVIKSIGDELMIRFDSAAAAAQAAILMQQQNRSARSPFTLRIGFHHGPVIVEDRDVFGDTVNTAARLTQAARHGQILTSEDTLQHCGDTVRREARPFDVEKLRGKSQALRLFELLWEPPNDVTRLASASDTSELTAPITINKTIALSVRQHQRRFAATDMPVTLGRESLCMFVVQSPFASRTHAQLEYRRGRFQLQDRSTNGTYVTLDGERESFIKGEALTLTRNGIISLGSPLLAQTGDVLRYQIE